MIIVLCGHMASSTGNRKRRLEFDARIASLVPSLPIELWSLILARCSAATLLRGVRPLNRLFWRMVWKMAEREFNSPYYVEPGQACLYRFWNRMRCDLIRSFKTRRLRNSRFEDLAAGGYLQFVTTAVANVSIDTVDDDVEFVAMMPNLDTLWISRTKGQPMPPLTALEPLSACSRIRYLAFPRARRSRRDDNLDRFLHIRRVYGRILELVASSSAARLTGIVFNLDHLDEDACRSTLPLLSNLASIEITGGDRRPDRLDPLTSLRSLVSLSTTCESMLCPAFASLQDKLSSLEKLDISLGDWTMITDGVVSIGRFANLTELEFWMGATNTVRIAIPDSLPQLENLLLTIKHPENLVSSSPRRLVLPKLVKLVVHNSLMEIDDERSPTKRSLAVAVRELVGRDSFAGVKSMRINDIKPSEWLYEVVRPLCTGLECLKLTYFKSAENMGAAVKGALGSSLSLTRLFLDKVKDDEVFKVSRWKSMGETEGVPEWRLGEAKGKQYSVFSMKQCA